MRKPRSVVPAPKIRCMTCGAYALKETLTKTPACRKHLYPEQPKQKNHPYKGERSKFLPKALVDAYEKAFVDDELISLREDIATHEARLRQLLSQLRDDPRNSTSWASVLGRNITSMQSAINKGTLTATQAFQNVLEFMETPVKEKLIWAEYYLVSDLKRKAVTAESKRLNELGWTPEMVASMFAEVAEYIKPLLSEENNQIFLTKMANSKLFNSQQFRLLDQISLSTRDVEKQLLAQEIEKKRKDIILEQKDAAGIYE